MEMCDPYGWHALDQNKIYDILSRLKSLESMRWSEILVTGKKRNHPIPISFLNKPARDRLSYLKLDDYDQVLSLGLSGKERIFGLWDNGIVRLLWWDPGHNVCPYYKKHT